MPFDIWFAQWSRQLRKDRRAGNIAVIGPPPESGWHIAMEGRGKDLEDQHGRFARLFIAMLAVAALIFLRNALQ